MQNCRGVLQFAIGANDGTKPPHSLLNLLKVLAHQRQHFNAGLAKNRHGGSCLLSRRFQRSDCLLDCLKLLLRGHGLQGLKVQP